MTDLLVGGKATLSTKEVEGVVTMVGMLLLGSFSVLDCGGGGTIRGSAAGGKSWKAEEGISAGRTSMIVCKASEMKKRSRPTN